jgi:superfamily II DNA or RNA helicase
MAIKVIIDSSHLKVFYDKASKEEKKLSESILTTKFCAKDSSMKMNPLVRRGLISDVRSFYNEQYNILPSGFWKFLKYYYDKMELKCEVKELRRFPKVDKEFLKRLLHDQLVFNNEIPRDYQKEAVMAIVKERGGICKLPVGTGKSLIMALILNTYYKANILILLNTLDLIEQTYRKLIEYGFDEKDIGVIQGATVVDTKRITILSAQSYEKAFGVFPRVHVIICDEVHETGRTDTAEKVMYACQNCSIKIGLSATPFTDNDFQTMRLYGNIGPIQYNKEITEQIEKGYLSPTEVEIYSYDCNSVGIKGYWSDKYERIRIKGDEKEWIRNGYEIEIVKDKKFAKRFLDYGDEYHHFVNNEVRNKKIVDIIKAYVAEGRRILVLFNRIEHGEILQKLYPEAILIHGQHNINERRAAELQLVEKPGTVVLVSKIWSQGKDIPLADCLINAAGQRATSRTIQKLGRVVRKAKGKDVAIVVDFDDTCLSPIGKKQSLKRIYIYQKRLKLPVCFKK